jgi:hypothetical protein
MDWGVWIGIAIGGVISLVASIVANLFHSKIVALLDSGTIRFKQKRRRSALKLHEIITQLHDGTRDRYFYMLRLSVAINSAFMIGVAGLFSETVLFALSSPPIPLFYRPFFDGPLSPEMNIRLGFLVFLLFITFVGAYLLLDTVDRFRMIVNALQDYEKYETEFKSKWGADVI